MEAEGKKENIRKIIADVLDVDISEVHDKARLGDDLKLDSLEAIEMIMGLEEALGIQIQDWTVGKFRTVSDVISFLSDSVRLLKKSNPADAI